MLTRLGWLYVPSFNQIIEWWSYIILSVGHLRLSLTFSSFFLHRNLWRDALTGPIPSEISTLTKLTYLYGPSLIEVIECWSYFYWVVVVCASLSAFQVFFWNALTGTIPSQISTLTKLSSLYAPKSESIYWVLAICFIECWSCAPLSQPFKFFSYTGGLKPFKEVCFLFTGCSMATSWLGQSQLKYLPWSS